MHGSIRIGLAGDTMLGRGVAAVLANRPADSLVSDGVKAAFAEADVVVLNLECCISSRGSPWNDPFKPFFFRAPPHAVGLLEHLGVDCVSLANNHALDFGVDALCDTLDFLREAGIAVVGAGWDVADARRPALLDVAGSWLRVIGLTDHPADYAARASRPGVAYADLADGVPSWIGEAIGSGTGVTLVTPHWGPNMRRTPLPYVERAARHLVGSGATLVAGHSAHVFQGVSHRVLFDLGDFLDDYAVDPDLRNDLGLFFLVDVAPAGPTRLQAIPLALEYCFTRLANDAETAWIARRFRTACAPFGTDVDRVADRLVVEWHT